MRNLSVRNFRKSLLFISIFSTGLTLNLWHILFPKSVGWDVAGFLLTGRRLGESLELPLISTFDNKPPLTFVYYAFPYLFNLDSANLLIVWQVLIVSLATTFCLLTFLGRLPFKSLLMAGVCFVGFFYLLPTSREWLTEINVLFVLSLVFMWREKADLESKYSYLVLGAIVALGIFTRTNLIFLAVLFNGLFFLKDRKIVNILYFNVSLGWFSFLVTLPYLLTGNFHLLYKGLVQIPLYSAAEFDFSYLISKSSLILIVLPSMFLAIGLKFSTRNQLDLDRYIFLSVVFVAVLIGVLADHPHFAHHNLQLALPLLMCVLFAIEKFRLLQSSVFQNVFFVLCIVTLMFGMRNDYHLLKKDLSYETENLVVEKVSQLRLEGNCDRTEYLWAIDLTYLNYRLNTNPVDPFMSATNLVNRPFIDTYYGRGASFEFALGEVIQSRPCLIVSPLDYGFLEDSQKTLLEKALLENYNLKFQSEKLNLLVYEIAKE
jgi:hypothetical protein